MISRLTLFAGCAALLATAACSSSGSQRAGIPDEFRVVKKPPLVVPPDYSLRPPATGTSQPREVDPSRADQALAFGEQIGRSASNAERLLVAKAGAIAVSPVIRDQIDYEEAGILHKPGSITDAVTGWSGSEDEQALAASDNATGGEEVTIEKSSGSRIKLPGT
ncbi:MAG: DUF3035 domain-containing protein [Pseudomonadota bacterium]